MTLILEGTERMPAFGGRLDESQVVAILDYLKTWWTPEERARQQSAPDVLD